MKATNIMWSVDFEEDLENLPTEIDIPNGITDEEEISDYITDETGFCHKGFELEELSMDYMRRKAYTNDVLFNIIKGYLVQILRNGKEYPSVVLGDLQASMEYVLKVNGKYDDKLDELKM